MMGIGVMPTRHPLYFGMVGNNGKAYANRAMAILWSAVWAVVLFRETIGLKQLIGIAFVVFGTVIVNREGV